MYSDTDPLMQISSGALLIASKPRSGERIVRVLGENAIAASIIGEFTPDQTNRMIVDRVTGSRLKDPFQTICG